MRGRAIKINRGGLYSEPEGIETRSLVEDSLCDTILAMAKR
jgi:hypothetical protein